jgi:hypothetical protein
VKKTVKDHKIIHTYTDEDVNNTKFVSTKYYLGIRIPVNTESNSYIIEQYPLNTDFEKAFPEFKESVLSDEEQGGYEVIYDDYTTQIKNALTISEVLNQYKEETISYKELEKNPDSFIGTQTMFQGKILQIQEEDKVDSEGLSTGGSITTIRLSLSDSNEEILINYDSLFGTDAVRDDNVTVYGTLSGSVTYESVAGYEITLPSMDAVVIE